MDMEMKSVLFKNFNEVKVEQDVDSDPNEDSLVPSNTSNEIDDHKVQMNRLELEWKQENIVRSVQMEKQAKRTRNKTCNKRWSTEDTYVFLQIIKENKNQFEKPTAQMFYKKIIADEEVSLGEYTWIGMRDRMKNLKVRYKNAIAWMANTGAELLAENNEKTVQEYILKLCPFFKEIDDIFGGKANVVPPFLFDSSDSSSLVEVDMNMDGAVVITPGEEDDSSNHLVGRTLTSNASRSPTSNEQTDEQLECPPLHSMTSYKERLTKNTRKRSVNAPLDYLSQLHESKSKYLADRLKFDELLNNQQLEFNKEKLAVEKKKLELERERMHEEFRLKELEVERNYQLQLERLKQETELKKLEIEVKYKTNVT